MSLDDLLANPVLKRAIAAGEERMGRVVGKLLASERVTSGIQTLISSAVQARSTLDAGVRQALRAANLPSRGDVAALKQRLAELETMIDGLSEKVDRGSGDAAPGPRR